MFLAKKEYNLDTNIKGKVQNVYSIGRVFFHSKNRSTNPFTCKSPCIPFAQKPNIANSLTKSMLYLSAVLRSDKAGAKHLTRLKKCVLKNLRARAEVECLSRNVFGVRSEAQKRRRRRTRPCHSRQKPWTKHTLHDLPFKPKWITKCEMEKNEK